MKKRILAVVLTLAMVLTMFSGCGKKDSSYFKEVKEMSKITTGTATAEINVIYSGDDVADIPELFKNAEGKVAADLKFESVSESNTKAAMKILIKAGQETEYAELTTFALVDKKVYLTVDPIIAFVNKIDAATATELETYLGQMGITGSISLDLEQILQAMGEEYPEINEDMEKSVYDLVNGLVDALENNFKELEGQDGDAYTLTLNGDNAETAVHGVINFLKNDAEGILEDVKAFAKTAYGEDSTMTADLDATYDEMINGLPDAVTSVEEDKADLVNAIKDNNINVTSKVQVSGKEGKREGSVTFDFGTIKIEESELVMKISSTMKEGEGSVDELIPADAADITTLLVTLINQMYSYEMEDYGTESIDVDDMSEDMDISDDVDLETEDYYVE